MRAEPSTSVRRPGDLKPHLVDRHSQFHETRNQQKSNHQRESVKPIQAKSQDHAGTRNRANRATEISSDLVVRFRILRQRVDGLKLKVASILEDVYKNPPDPGPGSAPRSQPGAAKASHEERKEPTPHAFKKAKLQVITGSNLMCQDAGYRGR